MLSAFLALFSLLFGFQVQLVLCNQPLTSSAHLNQRIRETIVPPYRAAYTSLNDDIVQPLLTVDINSDQPTIRRLVDSLLVAGKNVYDQLHKATNASENIRISIDEQVTQLVLSIENQEQQVRQSQAAVNQANIDFQSAQDQVNSAQGAVHDSQRALNSANQEVHDAEAAKRNAEVCGLGRRRKRFIRKIASKLNPVKVFREVIGKPVCRVVNSGGIARAKGRQEMAQRRVHETQQRLQNAQQDLASKRAHYDAVQAQLHSANTQLSNIRSALSEQRTKQALVTSWTSSIKYVEVHLNNLLGSSIVLLDELTELVNFNLVIQPLNDIYEEMINNNVMDSFNFKISAETAHQIKTNLEALIEKMPDVPLIDISTTDIEGVPSNDTFDTDMSDAFHIYLDEEVTDMPSIDWDEAIHIAELDDNTSK